jgi:hypothetical protein
MLYDFLFFLLDCSKVGSKKPAFFLFLDSSHQYTKGMIIKLRLEGLCCLNKKHFSKNLSDTQYLRSKNY